MAKDYYKVLGVSQSASADEIKAAFRKLAHQYHPDKAGGSADKFKEVNEAYQVLSNPQKRSQYDQFGSTFESAQRQGGFSGFEGFSDTFRNAGAQTEFNVGDLGDLFGNFFGGSRQRASGRTSGGADVETEVTIDLAQAYRGLEHEVRLNLAGACDVCKGSGAEPGSKVTTCTTCKGRGSVTRSIGFGIGMSAVCPACDGQGQKPERACKHCGGAGSLRKSTTVRFKIPAGIDDGQSIRLMGQGEAGGRGATPGDLYVRVRVRAHPKLERQGDHLKAKVSVSMSGAALGTQAHVPTLTGDVKVKIPEGTQSGSVIRLRGQGMPQLESSGHGDLLVTVEVRTPTKLNRQQKRLLEELGESGA